MSASEYNINTHRIVYTEAEPTPLAKCLTEEDAKEIQQTLERTAEELYGEDSPYSITQVEDEVRVFGEGGYEIVERTGEILEAPFFESRETAKELLEETAKKYRPDLSTKATQDRGETVVDD